MGIRSRPRQDGTMEGKAMFWCFDDAKRVPVTEARVRAGRIAKVGWSNVVLDVNSPELSSTGPEFQWLLETADNRDPPERATRDCTLNDRDEKDRDSPLLVLRGVPGCVVASSSGCSNIYHPQRTWANRPWAALLYRARWELLARGVFFCGGSS